MTRPRVPDVEIVGAYQRTGSVWRAAKELGLCGQSVHERLRSIGHPLARRKWTDDENAELRRLVASGLRAGEIAQRLGRTFAGVTCQLSRLDMRVLPPVADVKVPRGAGYDKASIHRHLTALERSDLAVTRYCRSNALDVETFVRACERHYPDRWFAYVKAHSTLPETQCAYCERWFHPNNGKQKYCTRHCGSAAARDKSYFGGQRRNTIGLAEGVCQLCGRKNVKGLSSHHVLGKENDPDNANLIALCRGCHKLVGLVASRTFVDDPVVWQTLIELAWLRRHGAALATADEDTALYTYVEIEVEPFDEGEIEAVS